MFCPNCGKELKDGSKFCDACGTQIQMGNNGVPVQNNIPQPNSVNMNGFAQVQKRKKNPLLLIIGIVAAILIVFGIFSSVGGSGNKSKAYINFVKEGHPEAYPDITYGKAFDDFFTNPQWKYFKSDKDKDIVEFSGGCTYQETDVTATLQFDLNIEDGSFIAEYFDMNGVPQSEDETNAIITAVFESYGKDNNDSELKIDSEETKESDDDTTTKELELSDYIGMKEDDFLSASGYEKNDMNTYPDMEHAAVICIDGMVNSLMINKYDSQNTFWGLSIDSELNDWNDVVSKFKLVDSSEIVDGMRNTYFDSENNGVFALDYDNQNIVQGISYAIASEEMIEEIAEESQESQETIEDSVTSDNSGPYMEEFCFVYGWESDGDDRPSGEIIDSNGDVIAWGYSNTELSGINYGDLVLIHKATVDDSYYNNDQPIVEFTAESYEYAGQAFDPNEAG